MIERLCGEWIECVCRWSGVLFLGVLCVGGCFCVWGVEMGVMCEGVKCI